MAWVEERTIDNLVCASDFNDYLLDMPGGVWKPTEIIKKHPCAFCHGITMDDSRGNCSACGAPREDGRIIIDENDSDIFIYEPKPGYEFSNTYIGNAFVLE